MTQPATPFADTDDLFDPASFVGERTILVTSQKEDLGTVNIEPAGVNIYKITYSVRPEFEQTLYYNPKTRTLDSNPKDGKDERSISFWERPGTGKNHCIYAMYRANQGVPESQRHPCEKGDKGTWGAEDG